MSGPLQRVLGAELTATARRRIGRFVPGDRRYEHHPPHPAARAPAYVGIGARATAGQWLGTALAAHPDVDTTGVPAAGLHFLDRFWEHPFTADDAHHYRSQFAYADPTRLTGEWTADYLLHRWCLEHLQLAAPEARVLVVLREPVARLLAEVEAQVAGGERFLTRLVENALGGSRYGRLLTQLFATVDPDRVLVLQHEDLVTDPGPALRRAHRFLGLDPTPLPQGFLPPSDPPVRHRSAAAPVLLDAVRAELAPDRALLDDLVAMHDLDLDRTGW